MFDDKESDFWKEQFIHYQHRNMTRVGAQRLSLSEVPQAINEFEKNHPDVVAKTTDNSSYITWETSVTPTVKLRVFFQSQIKLSLLQISDGDPVKICDAKFPYNPFPEIQSFLEHIPQYKKELEQLLNGNLKGDSADSLQKSLHQIRDNMNFMNDMNEMFNYVQLPLKMADSQANGDLYVYRRNNGKSFTGEEESLTALLHLSMETLGNMDIFLKLEQEKLSTKFCLEKEKIFDEERNSTLTVRYYDSEDGVCRTAFASVSGQVHECRHHTNENAWKFISQFTR